MCVGRLLLLSVVNLALTMIVQFGIINKNQASALEAIILGGAKNILGCSSITCNEAVRGDMGLDSLSSRQDRPRLA